MSTIARGYTLTDGLLNNYNFTTLHALVDAATVTSITLSELATAAHPIQYSATTPVADQGDGSYWFDTTLGILRQKNNNTRWDGIYSGAEMDNATGAALAQGSWVIIDGDRSVDLCATGMWPETLGVVLATIANGTSGIVATHGIRLARLVGPVTMGDVIVTAGTNVVAFGAGVARTLHSTGMSVATLGVPCGQALGSLATGVTGLVTCSIWR